MDDNIKQISDDLYLITLHPPLAGFNDFIGVWLYRGNITFLVDVGPSACAEELLTALMRLDVDKPDYLFLTHIHIDHAGGIGELAGHFRETPVVCHSKGHPHLVDPTRLWEGSVKTLGDTVRAYGPIKPISENQLIASETFASEYVVPVITPGHSAHHVSYLTDKYLFAGEAGGVFLSLPSHDEYLRPATPPKFFLETSVKSIDALMIRKPSMICYGHFGLQRNAEKQLDMHRDQLLLWDGIIRSELEKFQEISNKEAVVDTCMNRLLKEDLLLANLFKMGPDVQNREKGFLINSIRGFIGYIEDDLDKHIA